MPSLKAIRKRISSVKNTQKSTKAMKVVAAAKLRRVQDVVNLLRPYARRMQQVVTNLVGSLPVPKRQDDLYGDASSEQTGSIEQSGSTQTQEILHTEVASTLNSLVFGRKEKRIRVVLLSSERGLAGSFNTMVYRFFEQFVAQTSFDVLDLDVIGKKGREFFQRRVSKEGTLGSYKKPGVYFGQTTPGIDPKNTQQMAHDLALKYTKAIVAGELDALYFVYNEYQVGQAPKVRAKRLLPVRAYVEDADGLVDTNSTEVVSQEVLTTEGLGFADYIYEPEQRQIVEQLLPLSLETQIQRILLESISAELRSRMLAMDNASRNAKEMIQTLTLEFNRARQAAITKELMEVVSGAEAIKG